MTQALRLFGIALCVVLIFAACSKADKTDRASVNHEAPPAPSAAPESAAPASAAPAQTPATSPAPAPAAAAPAQAPASTPASAPAPAPTVSPAPAQTARLTPASTPVPAPVEATKPAPPPPPPPVVIHSGTVISVRTIDNIDVDAAQAGATFSASIDQPIVDGDRVVVSKGSEATLRALKVEQSGKMKGKDLIQLELTSIVVKGKRYQVATSFQEIAGKSEGKSTRRKILGGAGAGAVVGAIAGGGKGAAIGAAIGGSAGTAISASGEQHLKVPSETRLEFRLDNDLTIQEQVARAE